MEFQYVIVLITFVAAIEGCNRHQQQLEEKVYFGLQFEGVWSILAEETQKWELEESLTVKKQSDHISFGYRKQREQPVGIG